MENTFFSMTGFGSASSQWEEKKIHLEIKSINSKSQDIHLRLPSYYREKEIEIRQILGQHLERGKIDFYLQIEQGSQKPLLNTEKFVQAYQSVKKLAAELEATDSDLLLLTTRLPGVFENELLELSEKEWEIVQALIGEAIERLKAFRAAEGQALVACLKESLAKITQKLPLIESEEPARLCQVRERLQKNVSELSDKVDPLRFEAEVLFYIEKLDISEEKSRLLQHCQYFLEVLEQEKYPGKKLGFIAQEIGREVNTMGAKANHFQIQKWVIEMKEELEKIKEQLSNLL